MGEDIGDVTGVEPGDKTGDGISGGEVGCGSGDDELHLPQVQFPAGNFALRTHES